MGLGNGNVTVIDPNGRPIALMPPSFATLQNTVARIGNGNIVLPHLQPPTGFAPPTFTPHPPTVAPVGYFPGAPGGVRSQQHHAPHRLADGHAHRRPESEQRREPESCRSTRIAF